MQTSSPIRRSTSSGKFAQTALKVARHKVALIWLIPTLAAARWLAGTPLRDPSAYATAVNSTRFAFTDMLPVRIKLRVLANFPCEHTDAPLSCEPHATNVSMFRQ